MSADARTLAFYAEAAERYADSFGRVEERAQAKHFLSHLPVEKARILDLGCGPGNASALFAAAGHRPDPVDASAGMVGIAREVHGLPARLGTFDEDFGTAAYDGIWASYSLLHARRSELPGLIGRLARALRPGGPLYLGLKLGEGERRDSLGRRYAYVTEAELRDWLAGARLAVAWWNTDVKRGCAGTDDACVDVVALADG